jgi:hypothetical protein
MVEKNKKQRNKERRDAEKKARREANKAKVEKTKAEKQKKIAEEKKETQTPSEPQIKYVRDVWQSLDLEKQGITVHADGSYDPDEHKRSSEGGKKKKVKRAKHPEWRRSKGHGKMGRVCVVTKKGEHVRVNRKIAAEIVAAGGKYIPKWQYKGKVNGEEVDWSSKK